MSISIASPDCLLNGTTEMWREVLFWAFAMTTVLYLGVGLLCAVCLRPPKRAVAILVPFLYLLCAELKVLFTDAIASAFIAGIYSTVGWSMTALAALGWGVGLSLGSICLSSIISLVPFYSFL